MKLHECLNLNLNELVKMGCAAGRSTVARRHPYVLIRCHVLDDGVVYVTTGPDPQYAVNLTLYHVNEANYSGLANMNSGDVSGDASFMLRAAGLPWLCSNTSGQRDDTYDCQDIEQSASDLVVSKVIVEVRDKKGKKGKGKRKEERFI